MKKTLLFLALTATLTSCAPKVEYYSGIFTQPELQTTAISEIGDAIYTTEDVVYRNAVKIVNLPTEPLFNNKFPYTTGDVIPLKNSTKKYDLYNFIDDYTYGTNGQLYHTANSMKYGIYGIAVDKASNKAYASYGPSSLPALDNKEGVIVENSKYVDPDCTKCFKKEFIYNGKSNNTLKFVYREFVQDWARPAFTQELQYDLNESNIIGFKGLRIEVLKSTNTTIEYKIPFASCLM